MPPDKIHGFAARTILEFEQSDDADWNLLVNNLSVGTGHLFWSHRLLPALPQSIRLPS